MKELKSLINKFRFSDQFVVNKTAEFLSNNSTADIVENLNRQQLVEGEDSLGKDLGGYSLQRTVERRDAGRQTDFIDLKFTGDFHDSIFAQGKTNGNTKASLVMGSVGDKWDEIQEDVRFKDAIGLNQENLNRVGDMIAEHLIKELNKYYEV